MSVRLWSAGGVPLLVDLEDEEAEGYRRRLIGFLPPEERQNIYVDNDGGGVLRPPVEAAFCTCGADAEGVWLEPETEAYEEDTETIEAD